MARRPRMAKALAVKTRNTSSVTAKIAGMESTAKMMSVTSTSTRTASSGVASTAPFLRIRKRWPWKSSVMGTRRRKSFRTRDFSGSRWSLRWRIIR